MKKNFNSFFNYFFFKLNWKLTYIFSKPFFYSLKKLFFKEKSVKEQINLLFQNENSIAFKKLFQHLKKNEFKFKTQKQLDSEIRNWILTYLWYNNLVSIEQIRIFVNKRKTNRIVLNYVEKNKNKNIKAISLYGKINDFFEEREYRKEAEKLKDQEYEELKKKIQDQSLLEIIKYDRLKELGMERVLQFPGLAYSQFRPYAFGRQFRPGDFDFVKPIGRSGPMFLISTSKADLKRYRADKRRIDRKLEKTYLFENWIPDELYPMYSWFLHFDDTQWGALNFWVYNNGLKSQKWVRRFDLVSWCSNPAMTYNRLLIFKTVYFYKKLFRRKDKKEIQKLNSLIIKRQKDKKTFRLLQKRKKNAFKFPRNAFIVHTRQAKANKEIIPQPTLRHNKYKSKTVLISTEKYPLFLTSGMLRGTFWKYWAPTVASKENQDDEETSLKRGEDWWRGTHYLAYVIYQKSYLKRLKAHAKNIGTYIYYKNWKRRAMDIYVLYPPVSRVAVKRAGLGHTFWSSFRVELDVFAPLHQRIYDSEFALIRRKIRTVSRHFLQTLYKKLTNNFTKLPLNNYSTSSKFLEKYSSLTSELSMFSDKFNNLPNHWNTLYSTVKNKWAYAWVPKKRLFSEDNIYKPRYTQYNCFYPGGYRYMFTTLTLFQRFYILYTYLLTYFFLIPFIKLYGYILRKFGLAGLFESYYYLTRKTGFRYFISYKYDNFTGAFYPLLYGFIVWFFINLIRFRYWFLKWWWAKWWNWKAFVWTSDRLIITTAKWWVLFFQFADIFYRVTKKLATVFFLYYIFDIYKHLKNQFFRIKKNYAKWSKRLASRSFNSFEESNKYIDGAPHSSKESLFMKKIRDMYPDRLKAWKNFLYWNLNSKGILWDETDENNYLNILDKIKISIFTFLKGYPKYGHNYFLNNDFSRIGKLNQWQYMWYKNLNKSLYRSQYAKRKIKIFNKVLPDPNSEAYKKKMKEQRLAMRVSLAPKQRFKRFFNKELRDVITLDKQQTQYLKLLIKSTNNFFNKKNKKEKRRRFDFIKPILKEQPINLFTWKGLLKSQAPGYVFNYYYLHDRFNDIDSKNKYLHVKDPILSYKVMNYVDSLKVDDCLFLILIWELPKREWLGWVNNYIETSYALRLFFRHLMHGNASFKEMLKKFPRIKMTEQEQAEHELTAPKFFSAEEKNQNSFFSFLPFLFFIPSDKQFTLITFAVEILNNFN